MSIRAYMEELSEIKTEIKSLTTRKYALSKKADEIEDKIINYLREKDLPGVKYNGLAVMVESKPKRGRKKACDAKEDALKVLKDSGIHHNTEEVLERLLEARRGEALKKEKLKFVKRGV